MLSDAHASDRLFSLKIWLTGGQLVSHSLRLIPAHSVPPSAPTSSESAESFEGEYILKGYTTFRGREVNKPLSGCN